MFNKFQILFSKIISENVAAMAFPAGTTTQALGEPSSVYGFGHTTAASEADMSIAGGVTKSKRKRNKKHGKKNFFSKQKAVLYTARRARPAL
jgi:hypothetical protein